MAPSTSSSYQVLARRYRPQLFQDVVGQQAVVQQLRNEIAEGRVGHGYLFCGPRGTGKTSLARIFAKALNCINGPTPQPCGQCASCQEITAGTHLDIIEIDAATYTKVDDMRELLQGISRAPFSARFKVYIIDEVHMLSNSSFNALLKSLEEPPSHVVFILATTNPEKIPETVLSRCRRCNFERISLADIVRNLSTIIETEKVKVAEDERQAVLNAVALASDGGLRDAQVTLDQLISLAEDELNLETVRSLLGVVEGDLFTRLLKALVDRDTKECLLIVGNLVDRGRDLQRFVKMFLAFLRDAMIVKAGGSDNLLRILDTSSIELRELLDRASLPFLLNVVQQFLDLEERLRGAAPPRFLVEFALVKLTAIDPRLVIDQALSGGTTSPSGAPPSGGGTGSRARSASPAAAPRRADAQAAPHARLAAAPVVNDSAISLAEAQAAMEPAIEAIHTTDSDRWAAFTDQVGVRQPSLRGILAKARLVEVTATRLVIELAGADRAMKPAMDRPEIVNLMREAAQAAWHRPLMPRFQVAESNGETPLPVAPTAAAQVLPPADDGERTPLPARPAVEREQFRVEKPITFQQALEQFPQFREACSLIEQHLGIKPVAFNGRKLAT